MAYRQDYGFTSQSGLTVASWVEDDVSIPKPLRRPRVGVSRQSVEECRGWADRRGLPWSRPAFGPAPPPPS